MDAGPAPICPFRLCSLVFLELSFGVGGAVSTGVSTGVRWPDADRRTSALIANDHAHHMGPSKRQFDHFVTANV